MHPRSIFLFAAVSVALVGMTSSHGPASLGLLIPLVPIATLTGHAGLGFSGLTGVALLKLKAAAALAGFLLFRKGGGHIGIQVGGNEGWGWEEPQQHEEEQHGGWERSGWGRSKRSAIALPEGDAKGETGEIDLAQYDPSLDEVLAYDQYGCGLRLVCELAATPYSDLADDERLILELFGRDEKAPNAAKSSRGKLSYSYANILGGNARDASVCGHVYGMCPYPSKQIMQSLRDANV